MLATAFHAEIDLSSKKRIINSDGTLTRYCLLANSCPSFGEAACSPIFSRLPFPDRTARCGGWKLRCEMSITLPKTKITLAS
jgi:hypothetical protein